MTETTVGREPVQIVELVQPFCSHTFGSSPCTATGTKCFNTRASCADPDNFDKSSLSLFFSKGNVAERGVSGATYILPSLVSVSTTPTKINLSAANPDAQGLGNRSVVSITFADHPHTDRVVDPYVTSRGYDPFQRGSFWSKWMKRNKYRYAMTLRVYEGYAGQALSAMTKRSYILTGASGPDENGKVTLQGKDILARIEERKAQVPEASPGMLASGISDTATTLKVQAAVLDDYDASGTLRIGDELVTYSAVSEVGTKLEFAVTARGTDGTTAESHDDDDTVQMCVRYTDEPVEDIVEDLLDRGDVDSTYIDTTSFADEPADHLTAYTLSAVLSEPVAVTKLISELQEQCGFIIWWDERLAKVKMKAVRGIDADPDRLTDADDILKNSFSVWDVPKSRISQVWLYYNRRSQVGGFEPPDFKNVKVQADLASESEDQFGESSVRKIRSRWLATGPQALNTSSKIISRYRDVPRMCRFQLDAKDRAFWVGDSIEISHFLDVDEFGERNVAIWTIISAEEKQPGEVVEYTAEDTTLYGRICRVQAASAADYITGDDLFLGWIGDASGLLSDGEQAGRLS